MNILDIQSIRAKLTLLIVAVSGVAVLVATAAFLADNFVSLRRAKVEQLSALTSVIAYNSTAALSFRRQDAAEELLSSLKSRPTVQYACLFDDDNRIFATYNKGLELDFAPTAPRFNGHLFTVDGYLEIVLPVEEDGEQLGLIYVRATMSDLDAQLARNSTIAGTVLAASWGIALLLAVMLQRVISAPILALGAAAEQISAKRDYSIRVKKRTNDEIGFLYDQFNHMLEHIQCGEAELRKARDELEIRVQERTKQLSAANGQLQENIAQREQTAKQIEEMHQQLVDAARQAGMAEIAAGVLHNIGNLLNSVNVSVTVLAERLRESEVKDLQRALEIMQQHQHDLALFITHNDQGKHLPGFLLASGQALESERTELIETVHSLAQHIEHIKAIISTQQSYAGMSGLLQTVRIEELIEDALQMASGSLQRHAIDVVKEIGDLPQMTLDKHRMLLILVNLIKNAKDAVANNSKDDKKICIRARRSDKQTFRIEVSDNGEGIAKENTAKIFSHGFTTKAHGHGFGLHSVAIAAREMSGRIGVASDGLGRGATFTLELPISAETQDDSTAMPVPPLDAGGPQASCAAPGHGAST